MKPNTNVVSDDIKSDLDTVLQIRVTKKKIGILLLKIELIAKNQSAVKSESTKITKEVMVDGNIRHWMIGIVFIYM